jgi:cell division protein FtsA
LLFADGGIAHTSVIPAGGNNITLDVAAGLRTPVAEAERLKRNYGCALGRMIADDEEIEVPGVGGHAPRRVARRLLSDIIEPRVEELFGEARRRIEETGMLEQVSSGCVLTGGAALMEGMVESAQEILGMPVRLGFPVGVKGIFQLVQGPQYATGVGLVRYGAQKLNEQAAHASEQRARVERVQVEQTVRPQGSKLWSWVRAAF